MISNYDEAAQVLRTAGYYFHDRCNCGGSLQYKWRKSDNDYEIGILVNKKMFTVRYASTERHVYTGKYEQFEETLKNYV